MICNRNKTKLC